MALMLKLYGTFVKSLWIKLLSILYIIICGFSLFNFKYIDLLITKKLSERPFLAYIYFPIIKKLGENLLLPEQQQALILF